MGSGGSDKEFTHLQCHGVEGPGLPEVSRCVVCRYLLSESSLMLMSLLPLSD